MSKHSSRGTEWDKKRQVVLERAGRVCEKQGCLSEATHVDHILPKVHGGTDDLDNLQALCREHNLKKGSKVMTRTTYYSPRWFDSSELKQIAKEASRGIGN